MRNLDCICLGAWSFINIESKVFWWSNLDVFMQILSNIEAAQRNNRLFATLKEGNTALQQLQKQVALEDVERLNDETAEARDYQEQLRDLLGQSLSAQDDAEALEELERIQVQPSLCNVKQLASTKHLVELVIVSICLDSPPNTGDVLLLTR